MSSRRTESVAESVLIKITTNGLRLSHSSWFKSNSDENQCKVLKCIHDTQAKWSYRNYLWLMFIFLAVSGRQTKMLFGKLQNAFLAYSDETNHPEP